jgi:hypothetical protein
MTTNGYRMVGTTDDVTTCDQCGKQELRGTVVLEWLDTDGQPEGVAYFGSTCAARALAARGVRTTAARVRDMAAAAQRQRLERAAYALERLARYSLPTAPGPVEPAVWTAAVDLFAVGNAVALRNNPRMSASASLSECVQSWWAAVAA